MQVVSTIAGNAPVFGARRRATAGMTRRRKAGFISGTALMALGGLGVGAGVRDIFNEPAPLEAPVSAPVDRGGILVAGGAGVGTVGYFFREFTRQRQLRDEWAARQEGQTVAD
ncbi:MAG: hypothetical protein AB7P76_06680 [Candidatus Melainabacteria bacterium]